MLIKLFSTLDSFLLSGLRTKGALIMHSIDILSCRKHDKDELIHTPCCKKGESKRHEAVEKKGMYLFKHDISSVNFTFLPVLKFTK